MAKKVENHYLINGDQYESHALFIPYKDTYYKNVEDISDMDKATIALGTNYRKAIQECNPHIKLGTNSYVAKTKGDKVSKIYKPIEVFESNEKVQKILDSFMEYVDERNYSYYHSLGLDIANKDKVVSLVHNVVNSVKKHYNRSDIIAYNSIIAENIINSYLHNAYMFRTMINYTQLRNFIINYLHIVANKDVPTSYQLTQMNQFSNYINGLYQLESEDIKEALEEYKKLVLNAKDTIDMQKAIQEFREMIEERNQQMTLFDICPCEELKFLQKK